MKVQVFGPGCASCKVLHEQTLKAVNGLGLPISVEYCTDMSKIVEAGIMSVPALVVDGAVVSSGKVLDAEEIKKLLSANKELASNK